MHRIQQAVPKADVVVTNPTHFAVALQYDQGKMHAPRVVAKGADMLALRVRQVAAAHGVPIVERPPLARGLYWGVEVGREIDPEFYEAVAEVLAYVYRLKPKEKVA
jgi:flagellar biosynthetic protein FlhB